jgi:hypothetical protein
MQMCLKELDRCLKESDRCVRFHTLAGLSHLLIQPSVLVSGVADRKRGEILEREKTTGIKQGRSLDTRHQVIVWISCFMLLIYWETICSLCTMGFQLPSKHSLAFCTPTRMQCLTIEKCNWVSYSISRARGHATSNTPSPKIKFSACRSCCECRACRHWSTSRIETRLSKAAQDYPSVRLPPSYQGFRTNCS